MSTLTDLTQKFDSVWPLLDERTRRIMAANEAMSLGFGGVTLVHRASGLSRQAITRGIHEIESGAMPGAGRVRRPGAGRKTVVSHDPDLPQALDALIEGGTRGDPESPLRWICKSTRTIARALTRQRHPVSYVKVAQLLHAQHYSLQGNRKTQEGADHPDRDAQFRHISTEVKRYLGQGWPVISVDTKKKEILGNYANQGRQWLPAKQPRHVQDHDFPSPEVPRAYPYGIYDIGRNAGFVNIGTDHDTSAFAVASIRGWWRAEGRRIYCKAKRILITADSGGSNGYRLRLRKLELPQPRDATAASEHTYQAKLDKLELVRDIANSARQHGANPLADEAMPAWVHKQFQKQADAIDWTRREAAQPAMQRTPEAGSARRGLAVKDVQVLAAGALKTPAENLGRAGITVVKSFDALPQAAKAALAQEGVKAGEIRAFHWKGKSYLLADQMDSPARVQEALFHEHYTHGGLRAKYGSDLKPKLTELLHGLGGVKGVLKLAAENDIDLRPYTRAGASPQFLMEELMAHASKLTGTLKRVVQEYVGALRAWLREHHYANLGVYPGPTV